MKKILIFVDNLNEGGVSKVLFDFLECIDNKKYDITVMSLYNQGRYVENIKKHNKCKYQYCFNIPNEDDNSIKAILYRKFWGGMLRLPEKFMYKYFVKEKYDIEVAFMHGWSTKFISASYNKHSKKIAWVHVDLVTWNRVDNVFKDIEHHKLAYSKFDKVLCVSEAVKKGIEEKYNVKNAILLYNPINKEKILNKSKEPINKIDNSKEFNIISVGRLSIEKGYDRLLKVFNKLTNDNINCKLSIVGSGEEYEAFNNYIKKNDLQDHIKLLGYQENPYKYIKNSDLFVCSSRSEGFSLVIAEALVLGIPVVSVDCSGPSELLGFGEYGLLVENNEEKLFDGLKEIITNRKLYNKYKDKSKERSEIFSLNKFKNDIEEIFDTI